MAIFRKKVFSKWRFLTLFVALWPKEIWQLYTKLFICLQNNVEVAEIKILLIGRKRRYVSHNKMIRHLYVVFALYFANFLNLTEAGKSNKQRKLSLGKMAFVLAPRSLD